MAIEKTFLNNSMSELKTYLEQNAVPEYFDKIEYTDGGSMDGKLKLKCYIGDIVFCEFICGNQSYGGSTKTSVTFTNNVGKKYTVTTSLPEKTAFDYVTKCNNGISLAAKNCDSAVTITKDEARNTVIIMTSTGDIKRDGTPNTIYAISIISGNIVGSKVCQNPIAQMTSMSQIVVSDSNHYTPNAFIMIYSQINSEFPLYMNGSSYWSNGLWCIKD